MPGSAARPTIEDIKILNYSILAINYIQARAHLDTLKLTIFSHTQHHLVIF